MTDQPAAADIPADRRVSAYGITVGPYWADVRLDLTTGRWYIDSMALSMAQGVMVNAGQIVNPEDDPQNARWDDPEEAQDAAETTLRAMLTAVQTVQGTMPTPPAPPPADAGT
jgi:hypothetical protein